MNAIHMGRVEPLTDHHSVLVIDDEESIRFFLEKTLGRSGYDVVTAADGEEGLQSFRTRRPDIVITDLKMPGLDGIGVLERVKTLAPEVPVVMITGFGTIENAVEAMKRGADDYLTKPFDGRAIRAVVKRILQRRETPEDAPAAELVGASPALDAVREQVAMLARTEVTVLIQGESGTGKELVAKAIHRASPKHDRPFVAVHCAAFPPTLLEAELFGHTAGAFTGAVRERTGLAARAADGTLFLDEVGDIPLPVQSKLLRLLQEREILPVGADETIPLRARVMAATHRDLAALIEDGAFREDLYYRLNVVPVHIPPLRERRQDIVALLDHFLAAANRAQDREVAGFSPEVIEVLSAYPWPGNVRELANLVERLVALKETGPVETADLPQELQSAPRSAPVTAAAGASVPFEAARRAFEREFFARLLGETRGNVSEAARRAGISRPNLYRRLKEAGLDPGEFKKG